MRHLLATLLVIGFATACAAPRSARCKRVCETEERCIEIENRRDISFDRGECEAACSALERDDQGAKQVKRHIKCIAAAQNECSQVVLCME